MVELAMKRRPYYECSIYIGSIIDSTGESFTQKELELFCGKVQEQYEFTIPLRITTTTFVSDTTYQERGWEITAIDYPKLFYNKRQIKGWMRHLAESLLVKFQQHTICIVDKDGIIMLENERAIFHHSV